MMTVTSGSMNLLKQLNSFLNKPFPGPESLWSEVKGLLVAAFIVFAFLFLFKPFGMNTYPGSALLLSLKFGLVSFVASLAYVLFTTYVIRIHKDIDTWTMKHWILDILLMVMIIAVANYVFISYHYNASFSLAGLINMLVCTVMVAIFPVIIFGFKKLLQTERLNSQSAASFTESLASHKENKVHPDKFKILSVESMQNYVHVYKISEVGLEKETLRMTLTKALEEFSDHGLIKCHRSFLVNPTEIERVDGNAQGLRLTLSHEDCPIIPVSRTYISAVKSAL